MERLDAARCLLVSVGLVIAGSAAAQSSGKAPSATSTQGSTKSAPAKAPAPKSLDFAPSTSAKDAPATRTATPVATQPAQSPVKDRSNCHSSASDA
ncbi:MAG TPA: hypothetical protein VIW70_10470 [Rubrivivax sp.]